MALRVALVHPATFPVLRYGGTERVIWWLAKGLKDLGHQVQLVCLPGSTCPYAEIKNIHQPLPDADVYHFFHTPKITDLQKPYLVTIEGNGQPQEKFLENTVFVSENHAKRHGSKAYVYNGLDPDDYRFQKEKENRLLFLAKAKWRVKNVKGAIRIARTSQLPLDILGGTRFWLPHFRGVFWRGMLGGEEKAQYLAQAKGLLFPVLWHEPFGIAVVEALVSGTPVLVSPFGSLPELVTKEVGKICQSYSDFRDGVQQLSEFSPQTCREWAISKFHYLEMTKSYLKYYETVLSGKKINPESPTLLETSSSQKFQL